MGTLKEHIYDTIHRNKKPLKLIAEEVGMSENYLTRAGLPDPEEVDTGSGCRFPLKKLIPVIRSTRDFQILDHLEEALGRVAIALPDPDVPKVQLYRLALQAVAQFGELMARMDASMADNRLTRKETDDIRIEGYEAVQAIMSLLKSIKNGRKDEE